MFLFLKLELVLGGYKALLQLLMNSSLNLKPDDKVYFNFTDIQTTYLSAKLSHWCFRPYVVKK